MRAPGSARLRSLVGRGRRLREHDDEVQNHLLLLASDLERRGWAPDEARREARRRFGGPDQIREAYRDVAGFPSVDALMQDLRYGIRMLRRQPGFSLLVVLLVAIGVGANTAIFSLVDAVLLRPLPYKNPGRLVVVREVIPALADTYPSVPAASADFLLWQGRVPAFDAMAAVSAGTETLTGAGDPARLDVARVTSTLFPLLGVTPVIGRAFTALEDQEGRADVAVPVPRVLDRALRRRPRDPRPPPHLERSAVHGDRRLAGRICATQPRPAWRTGPAAIASRRLPPRRVQHGRAAGPWRQLQLDRARPASAGCNRGAGRIAIECGAGRHRAPAAHDSAPWNSRLASSAFRSRLCGRPNAVSCSSPGRSLRCSWCFA